MKRYDDEDDPFDERGVLKDGRRLRVPMSAMDGVQRAIAADLARRVRLRFADGSSDPVGHRPGFIIAEDNGRAVIDAAYRESVRELQLAWRKPGGDQSPIPSAAPMSAADALSTDLTTLMARLNDARRSAYESYVHELTNAWRRPG
jgi:hypothetical protein